MVETVTITSGKVAIVWPSQGFQSMSRERNLLELNLSLFLSNVDCKRTLTVSKMHEYERSTKLIVNVALAICELRST